MCVCVYVCVCMCVCVRLCNQRFLNEYFVDKVLSRISFVCRGFNDFNESYFWYIPFSFKSVFYLDVHKRICQTIHLEKSLSDEKVFNVARRLTCQTLVVVILSV